jgi:hypothetical protein
MCAPLLPHQVAGQRYHESEPNLLDHGHLPAAAQYTGDGRDGTLGAAAPLQTPETRNVGG